MNSAARIKGVSAMGAFLGCILGAFIIASFLEDTLEEMGNALIAKLDEIKKVLEKDK